MKTIYRCNAVFQRILLFYICQGSQAKNVTRMSKVEKKAAVACLAKVYSGVSVKKLFKRCHLQLERCKKAELEAGNTDRHFVDRRNVEAQLASKNGMYMVNK